MRSRLRASDHSTTVIAIALAISVGCANWQASDSMLASSETPLTEVGQSPYTPVIEVSFVGIQMETEGQDMADGIWQWVDETKIDSVQRHRLSANGIRVGFVSNEDQFRRRLAGETVQSDVVDQFLSQASVNSELSQGSERLPLRFGRRYELPLRQPTEGIDVTLLSLDDGPMGRSLVRPQHLLAITAGRATNTKQIELQFRPEIQHGDAKQKWITSDTAFRIDTRRDTWSLPELDLNVAAGAGDLLVITADTPPRGLGKQMLTGIGSDQAQQQVLLLIEVIQVGSH